MFGIGLFPICILLTILVNLSQAVPDYKVPNTCSLEAKGKSQNEVGYMCNSMGLGSCELQSAAQRDGLDSFAEYAIGSFGLNAPSSCCRCYQVSIQDPFGAEKDLIVQTVNNNGSNSQLDLYMMAGGFGKNNGCAGNVYSSAGKLWDGNSGPAQYSGFASDWCSDLTPNRQACLDANARGIVKRADCYKLPTAETIALCHYSFANKFRSETLQFRQSLMKEVRCPAGLRAVTGCDREETTLPLPTKRLAVNEANLVRGSVSTTWDCCKPLCAWQENVLYSKNTAVNTCDMNGNTYGVGPRASCKMFECHPTCKTCTEENNDKKCSSCSQGLYLSNGKCVGCPASMNCSNCSSESVCLHCNLGYRLLSNGQCLMTCHPLCDGCTEPNNGLKCVQCLSGYYLHHTNGCVACPKDRIGCTECLNATICKLCPANYIMQDDKTCKAVCHSSCKTCSVLADYFACTSCSDGLVLNKGTCVDCYWPCKTCTGSPSTCSTCIEGYKLSASGMICQKDLTCHSTCKDCSSSYNASACTACASGKYLSNNQCLPCDSSCATCQNASTCTTCPAGKQISSSSLCVTLTTQTMTLICHPNCKSCSQSYKFNACTSCNDGNYLSGTQCLTCSWNCQTCFGSDTTCLTCPYGKQLSGTTCVTTTTKCHPKCSTCNAFNNENACTSCPTGFFLQGNNCLPCSSTCFMCSNHANNCLACPAGTSLYGTTCQPVYKGPQQCHTTCINCFEPNNASRCVSCMSPRKLTWNLACK